MPRTKIYDIFTEYNVENLVSNAIESNAKILIPNLQRSYVWEPNQVVLLVDSLIHGWPFGTLLLWEKKLSAGEGMDIPCRSFQYSIDRRNSYEVANPKAPTASAPATFSLVLDGQQRLQSLILAVGGGEFGFYYKDSKWADILKCEKSSGSNKQWSFGQLCLCLDEFCKVSEESQIDEIDYTKILKWVICYAIGFSTDKRKATYESPLVNIVGGGENSNKYIRFSKLWEMARSDWDVVQHMEHLKKVLKEEYNLDPDKNNISLKLARLLGVLGAVKTEKVSCLRLNAFDATNLKPDEIKRKKRDYLNSIVNVFTRLNKAGTELTEQEITFAWIKVGWDEVAKKKGDSSQANEEYDNLLKDLRQEYSLTIKMDDLVEASSVVWSMFYKNGEIIKGSDLLDGELVRGMAEQLYNIWKDFKLGFVNCCKDLDDFEMDFGKHFDSFYSIIGYLAWSILLYRWKTEHNKSVTEQYNFDKEFDDLRREFIVDWFVLTHWAGIWGENPGRNLQSYIQEANRSWEIMKDKDQGKDAISEARKIMGGWITALRQRAVEHVNNQMSFQDRNQVRRYYTPLWVWHSLSKERWEMSKIPLRIIGKKDKRYEADVDHIVAFSHWRDKLNMSEDNDDEMRIVNSIGNMSLLQKDFNRIAKSAKSLEDFIDNIDLFKGDEGAKFKVKWQGALLVDSNIIQPSKSDKEKLVAAVKQREDLIKKELIEYALGKSKMIQK